MSRRPDLFLFCARERGAEEVLPTLLADVRPGYIALVAPLPMTMARSHTLARFQVITSSAAPLTHTCTASAGSGVGGGSSAGS